MKSNWDLDAKHLLRIIQNFSGGTTLQYSRSHLRVMFQKALTEIAGFQNQYVLNYRFEGKERRGAPPPPSPSPPVSHATRPHAVACALVVER